MRVLADRAKLEEILSRPEFAASRVKQGNFFERILEWIGSLLTQFFESTGMQGFSMWTRVLVLALAIATVVVAVVLLMRRWRRRRSQGAAASSPAASVDTRLVLDSPIAHLGRARALLAASPRDAIRQGLLALLSSLERARLARPDRVKTNRELSKELLTRGAAPELSAQVRPLLEWYDGAFYSLEPVANEEAARFVEGISSLSAGLEAGR